MEGSDVSTKKWDVKKDLESLSRFNHLGLDFYKQTNYIERIAEVVGINIALLYDWDESVYTLQNVLMENQLESELVENLGELNNTKLKEIIGKIESELLLYLMTFDEYKKGIYKIKARRGFVEIGGRYCPVLIKRNGDIDMGLLRYLVDRFVECDYFFGVMYGNARHNWKVEWEKFYITYSDLKIILSE